MRKVGFPLIKIAVGPSAPPIMAIEFELSIFTLSLLV